MAVRPVKPMKSDVISASAADLRADRIRTHRRIAVRAGLLVIALTSATACIFDRSTYQGGGHSDQGATAVTQTATTPPPPDDGGGDTGLGGD
jgi:hypothetical protein